MGKGNLYVVSGPSGVGKGTVVSRIVSETDGVWISVSATTRAPRPGEIDGESYRFLSVDDFRDLIENDGLLEWASYGDNYYGTPRSSVDDHLASGFDVILEIEVQGAMQVKSKMPDARLIFIAPPSIDELKRRLTERNTETDDVIEKRMATAEIELSKQDEYDRIFTNDDLEECVENVKSYLLSNRE